MPKLEYISREEMKDLPPDRLAWACRVNALYMVAKAGRGHLGTSLSSMEAILAIRRLMGENDVFIGSKGHDAAAQYSVLIALGILSEDRLHVFRTTSLPGHPELGIPGIFANNGSLGMGISKSIGFARTGKGVVYCLLGDGEMMEGQNWEAALFVKKKQVENIVAIVDCNGLSQDATAFLSIEDIYKMFRGAGWTTGIVKDGNNYQEIKSALRDAKQNIDLGPWAILLKTTKGKGISDIEGRSWSHAGPPQDYEAALSDLKTHIPDVKTVITEYEFQEPVRSRHPFCQALGDTIKELIQEDSRIVVLGTDTLDDHNLVADGQRIIDCGIAEQNTVSMASALALDGYKPIVVTYARFLSRAHEQIYNQVTERTPVVYVGSMAGKLPDNGPGISHESLNDETCMATMMPVITPGNETAVDLALRRALMSDTSVYIRLMQQ